MSISIPYTCIQLHNNQYKWTKKLECMLKHHLTQFDKTLTLKLYIKIAYKKQYNPEPHLWTSIQPPPPFPLQKQTKKPFCKDMENVLRQHVMYVKQSKTWNMINDIAHLYGRRRSCGLTYIAHLVEKYRII